MYSKTILFILFLTIISIQYVNSRGGRGGGSRGGGSRSSRIGSRTRSGSRSGSAGMIGGSSRYSMWTRSHGYPSSFRYRTTAYTYKYRGIQTGMIIISPYQRRTLIIHSESSFNDISICYNEFALYDRNTSQSPWFVCPWLDTSERYCCGDEIEERCCRYFERPGHLAGLIIGFLIIILIIAVTCYYCRKRSKRSHKSSVTMIYMEPDKGDNDEIICETRPLGYPENNQYPGFPINNPSMDTCPPYPQQNGYGDGSPPYPLINNPDEPYPLNPPMEGHPPYPVNPTAPEMSHGYPMQSASMGYDHGGPSYPLIPPENPPPAYSDVVKQQ